ncbi:MAG: hypothetical protein IKH65_09130, partial [Clostridia bacterium]|nr:hypothetical protein [Clostridia bacterium]
MNNSNEPNNSKKRKLITLIPYILIPAIIILGISYYAEKQSQVKMKYYEIVQLFEEHKVDQYRL